MLLTQGTEVKGKAGLEVTRGRYRYLFADTENQHKFEAAPDQYGIQFDGYCMKMGPLSGRGSPERWFVSEGRIYLFASKSCRDNFISDPAAYTDRADAPPTGSAMAKWRGHELIALALVGFGGADKVDALKNVRWETITIYEPEGKKTEMQQATTVVLPDQLRLDYSYGDFREGHELADGRLVEVNAQNEATPLPAEVYDFVRRRLYREPLALLRARGQPDFAAFAAGKGEINGQSVEWLTIGYAGATTKLGIEPGTGRILAAVYRGRGRPSWEKSAGAIRFQGDGRRSDPAARLACDLWRQPLARPGDGCLLRVVECADCVTLASITSQAFPRSIMPEPKLRVLAVVGSTHAQSVTRVVLTKVAEDLRCASCEVDLLDLSVEPLALFNPETAYNQPGFAALRARVEAADVLLLGTPDYHGSISSALKNFLDHFWREFAGKLFATIVASHEKGLTVTDQLRTVARQCYAWSLPYGVAFADKQDVAGGQIISDALRERLEMLVRDARVYGGLLSQQRRSDLAGNEPGFLARLRK